MLNKGSINISLNNQLNQLNQLNPEIPVAELVSDNTNVTIRRKTRKIKEHVKKMLIIEEDEEPIMLCQEVVKEVKEVKEVEVKVEKEEDEEELFEIEIDGVSYCTNDEENGIIYELTEEGDVGKKLGYLKDGEPFL